MKLVEDGDVLRAEFALSMPFPTSADTAQLSLQASNQDGSVSRQLGVKWVAGQPKVFVFDSGTAQNRYVDAAPVIERTTVAVAFPRSAVDDLGATWNWAATSSVDGDDVDACPDPGDDILNPQQETFPG